MYKLVVGSVEDRSFILAMSAHLSILFNTSQGIGTETCVMDTVFPLDESISIQVLKAVDYDIISNPYLDALKNLEFLF